MRHLIVFLAVASSLLGGFSTAYARASDSDAQLAIAQAEEAIKSMEDAGFGTVFSGDVLGEAKKALGEGDYDKAMEKSSIVVSRMRRALEIRDSLRALEQRIQDVEAKHLNASRATEIMSTAVVTFDKENYDEAETFVSQADRELDDVEAEYSFLQARYSAARDNLRGYLKEHARDVVVSLIILVLASALLYNIISMTMRRRKIQNLELEKDVLQDLIKKAQAQYYEKRSMSKSLYEIKTRKYRERTREIEEDLLVLRPKHARPQKISQPRRETPSQTTSIIQKGSESVISRRRSP